MTKSLLIMKPHFNVPANRCAMRTLLIDAGFVIVREEERLISGDALKDCILGKGHRGADAECAVYVVSREDAERMLFQLAGDNSLSDEDVLVPAAGGSADLLTALFPRMKRDFIPSKDHTAEYLDKELKMLLVKGLTDLAKSKPEKPVEALAEWLLANNPHRSAPLQVGAAKQ